MDLLVPTQRNQAVVILDHSFANDRTLRLECSRMITRISRHCHLFPVTCCTPQQCIVLDAILDWRREGIPHLLPICCLMQSKESNDGVLSNGWRRYLWEHRKRASVTDCSPQHRIRALHPGSCAIPSYRMWSASDFSAFRHPKKPSTYSFEQA